MQQIDIGIAGCGIAGLAAALMLHRQGHRITLYDRFEKPRPVGSGLMIQPTGLAVLNHLGLAHKALSRGAPIDALLGLNTEGQPVLEAAYADLRIENAVGIGIHRASLFEVLFDAVSEGDITVRTDSPVSGSDLVPEGRRLIFDGQTDSPAHDLVIDALGVGSTLVPQIDALLPFGALWSTVEWPEAGGFNPRLLEQRYRRADQMIGLLPVGQGKAAFFWSLKADDYHAWLGRGMDGFCKDICALWPEMDALTSQLTDPDQMTFARYAHRTSPSPAGERIAHIGDSWHAASPQLGQGANMALLDARGIALAIERSNDIAEALQRYAALRQSHVALYQWLTWGFTPPFQSDSIWPALFRDLLMAPGSRIGPMPTLKSYLVAGLAGAKLEQLELELPDYSALLATPSTSSTSSRAVAELQS